MVEWRPVPGPAAALSAGVAELVDPRISAPPELRSVFADYPHIGAVLPAMGYSEPQLRAMATTIEDFRRGGGRGGNAN